jgi:hypothetical protein
MVTTESDGTLCAIKNKIKQGIVDGQTGTFDRNAAIDELMGRLTQIGTRLIGRMSGLPDDETLRTHLSTLRRQLSDVDDQTLRTLVASGPWNTSDVGGEEVDVGLLFEEPELPIQPEPEHPELLDMMLQGFMLHTGMRVMNIGSSDKLTLDSKDHIDMKKTNTVFLPGVAPIAARMTFEPKAEDYEVRIECVGDELKIGHEGREGMGFTLKPGDKPVALQDKDIITIGGHSFRLDMATAEERRLFPNLTWIATLSLTEGETLPGFAPITLTGSESQVNYDNKTAPEFTFGFQRGESPEPTRNLPCPWISRIHFSLYFENRFFLRSGWEEIPSGWEEISGKPVYLLNEAPNEKSELQLLDKQERRPLGKQGKIFALPLYYHFTKRMPGMKTPPLTPVP